MAQPGHTGDVTAVGSAWGLASARSKLSVRNEPGSVSYNKLVGLDVFRCPRPNRQGVTESIAKENGTLVVFHTLWWKIDLDWTVQKDVENCISENVYISHWLEEVLYFSRGEKWRSHPEAYQFSWVSLWLIYHDCDEHAALHFSALGVLCSGSYKAWQRQHWGGTMH